MGLPLYSGSFFWFACHGRALTGESPEYAQNAAGQKG